MPWLFLVAAFTALAPAPTHAKIVVPSDASKYIGRIETVKGRVSIDVKSDGTILYYLSNSPSYREYDIAPFVGVLKPHRVNLYGNSAFSRRVISITGKIAKFHGRPAIFVVRPAQIDEEPLQSPQSTLATTTAPPPFPPPNPRDPYGAPHLIGTWELSDRVSGDCHLPNRLEVTEADELHIILDGTRYSASRLSELKLFKNGSRLNVRRYFFSTERFAFQLLEQNRLNAVELGSEEAADAIGQCIYDRTFTLKRPL